MKSNQARQNKLQKKTLKGVIAAPVKSLKGQEVWYRKQLNKIGKALVKAVQEEVLEYLKANKEQYVIDTNVIDITLFDVVHDVFDIAHDDYTLVLNDEYTELRTWLLNESRTKVLSLDGIGDQLNLIFNRLNTNFSGVLSSGLSSSIAEQMVTNVSSTNKRRFDKTINRATGVDLGGVVKSEGLEDFITTNVSKNVSLIESLPSEYLDQVEIIVNNGVASGARYETIAREIISKTGANAKLYNRIKRIATNEVQTINAQITLRRSSSLGITEGIFRTSKDEKVRPCHKELAGVRYILSQGAWSKTCQKYIKPGITDIGCR